MCKSPLSESSHCHHGVLMVPHQERQYRTLCHIVEVNEQVSASLTTHSGPTHQEHI